jgi:hypothetical protein
VLRPRRLWRRRLCVSSLALAVRRHWRHVAIAHADASSSFSSSFSSFAAAAAAAAATNLLYGRAIGDLEAWRRKQQRGMRV